MNINVLRTQRFQTGWVLCLTCILAGGGNGSKPISKHLFSITVTRIVSINKLAACGVQRIVYQVLVLTVFNVISKKKKKKTYSSQLLLPLPSDESSCHIPVLSSMATCLCPRWKCTWSSSIVLTFYFWELNVGYSCIWNSVSSRMVLCSSNYYSYCYYYYFCLRAVYFSIYSPV